MGNEKSMKNTYLQPMHALLQIQNGTNNTFTSTCISKANSACTEGVVQNYELGCVCDGNVEHMQNFKITRRRSQKITV